jgi:hypothetical protein
LLLCLPSDVTELAVAVVAVSSNERG